MGASTAYHLARNGWTDVVVVDQGPIPATGGSTSHAPGGFFVTNYSRAMTRLALETVDLLSSLDLDGEPCFYPVGTIELARTLVDNGVPEGDCETDLFAGIEHDR